jgi:hypothetical protein
LDALVVSVADKNFFSEDGNPFGIIKLAIAASLAAEFAQKLAIRSVKDLNTMASRVADENFLS